MGIQQVHHHTGGNRGGAVKQAGQPRGGLPCRQRAVYQIIDQRLGQAVVHHAVQLVARQPRARVVPGFAQDQRVRVGGLDSLAEGAQEIIADFIHHVQPPAVDAEFPYPPRAHAAEIIDHGGIAGVELGHVAGKAEGAVIALFMAWKIAVDQEKVIIRRGLAAALDVLKEGMMLGAVVEHAVQQHAHAARVRSLHQLTEGSLSAEPRVHIIIIHDAVFVVGGGGVNGRKIQAVNAQVAQVIQMLRYARQVAAKVHPGGWLCIPRRSDIGLFAHAVGKALRKNLVHDGRIRPGNMPVYIAGKNIGVLEEGVVSALKIIRARKPFFAEVKALVIMI